MSPKSSYFDLVLVGAGAFGPANANRAADHSASMAALEKGAAGRLNDQVRHTS